MNRSSKQYCRNVVAVTTWCMKPALAVLLLGLIAINSTNLTPVQATQAVQRPLSDFISTQGTTMMFIPPVPDYVGWVTAVGAQPAYGALVDYAGVANGWLVANGHSTLGTTFGGSITERTLADGRAEVSVQLHTQNALAFVFDLNTGDFATGTVLFGHRAQQVLAGADAALGESHLQVVFKNPAPGAPLPDLTANNFCFPPNPAGCELVSLSFRANASGALHAAFGVPEGTPGRAVISQTGVLFRGPFMGATADGFPVELIKLQVVGR